MTRVVAVGDCGVDRYLNLRADRAGGIAMNFAINAQETFSKDAEITVVSALGDDPEAAIVCESMRDHGLDHILPVCSGRTSLQIIDCKPDGEREFVRYEAGVLADFRIDGGAANAVRKSDVLIVACYRQVMDFFVSAIDVPSSGLRAVDFLDLTGFEDHLAPVEQFFDRFDIGFAGLEPSDESLIDRLDDLARRRGKLFIATLGAEGSVALGGADRVTAQAVAVDDVVDTTGAGDSFAAGFLASFSCHRDVAASLNTGARQGALTVQRFGAFDAELKPWPGGREPA